MIIWEGSLENSFFYTDNRNSFHRHIIILITMMCQCQYDEFSLNASVKNMAIKFSIWSLLPSFIQIEVKFQTQKRWIFKHFLCFKLKSMRECVKFKNHSCAFALSWSEDKTMTQDCLLILSQWWKQYIWRTWCILFSQMSS